MRLLICIFSLLLIGVSSSAAQTVETKVTPIDGAANDAFGFSVGVDNGVAIVGAYHDDDKGTDSGSAYIYRYNGVTWIQEQKINASDGANSDVFGWSVSISGDVALVGSILNDDRGLNSGSAYIYRYNGSSWIQEAKINASDGAAGDEFGNVVSIQGNVALIGSPQDDDHGGASGSVYVYRYNGSSWIQEQKITPSDGAAGDYFGAAVSLDDDVALIGARVDDDNGTDSGSAYIYQYDGTSWIQEQKILASDGSAGDWFGMSVSLSNDVALIGSRLDDDNGTDSGSAYIYRYNGTSWIEEQKTLASNGAADDWFGLSVSICGDVALMGAYRHDGNGSNSGLVYHYRYDGASWVEEQILTASDGTGGDEFGYAVSNVDNVVLVGAIGDDDRGTNSGSAYFYELNLNSAPALSGIGDQTVDEGQTLVVNLFAEDLENPPPLLSFSGLPNFAVSVDNGDGTGTLTFTPDFLDAGSYAITVTATDKDDPSLMDSETFTLTVNDQPLSITVDPGAYSGTYALSGTNNLSGINTVQVATGSQSLSLVSGGAHFFIDVAADGTVTSQNSDAATGTGNSLTFNTTPVTVDPTLVYQGTYSLYQITATVSGVQTVDLVTGLVGYYLRITHGVGFYFDVDGSGTVSSQNTAAASGNGSTLMFNTTTVTIVPSNPVMSYNVRGPASGGIGQRDIVLLPGLDNYISDIWPSQNLLFNVDGSGNISSQNTAAATGSGSILTFNKAPMTIDPASYTGSYRIKGYTTTLSGVQSIAVVPGLSNYTVDQLSGGATFQYNVDASGVPTPASVDVFADGGTHTFHLTAGASIFTVNTTGDGADTNPGDGCAEDGSGAVSLRAAIEETNALPGVQTIRFAIGSGAVTIQPGSALPRITDPVVIDGKTQPGFSNTPIVELDGTNAGTNANGLFITAGNTTVRGLVVNRFGQFGIYIETGGGNTVECCFIGTDMDGTSALGNGRGLAVVRSPGNTIGGTVAEARNVISGNTGEGIRVIESGSNGNTILGNFIGTDATGTQALGNGHLGVSIQDAANNTIGGTTEETRNVISANLSGIGISSSGATGNVVQGNYIGTDVTGTIDLGNRNIGVGIGSSGNTVGGTASGAGNLISGNGSTGLSIGYSGATGNVVQGNIIGTDVTGTVALGNGGAGITIAEGAGNTIGGTAEEARNLVSGNDREGVLVQGSDATGNAILGNYIGTNANGDSALPNLRGVYLDRAPGNTVGGTIAGARNLISGNNGEGVLVGGASATGNRIHGNYIGTDVTGTVALGNNHNGVHIQSSNNRVGGGESGAGNLIAGSKFGGIGIYGSDNIIQGNFIGTDASGTLSLGNKTVGIGITGAHNVVGGKNAGEGNIIAHNGAEGVLVGQGTGHAILGNAIYDNAGLGIELNPGGVTPNDVSDADTGANGLQNYPALTRASLNRVVGVLNSKANRVYQVELFVNDVCDPSGYGEGQTLLASISVSTDGSGNGPFDVPVAGLVAVGQFVTATATDSDGNTSEFAACVEVILNEPPVANAGPDQPNVECTSSDGAVVTLDGSGSSDPDGDVLTYTWLKDGQVIAGPTTDATVAVTLVLGNYIFELTVDDGNGETDIDTVSITVKDTTPPVIMLQGDTPLIWECGTPFVDPGAAVSDACDPNATLSLSHDVDVTKLDTYTVTYVAVDAQENTSQKTRTVEVTDTTPPTVVTQDVTVNLDENGLGSITPEQVDNGSTDNCDIASLSLDITAFTCENLGENTVTLTVTDGSSNSATGTATATVLDVTAPVVTLLVEYPDPLECESHLGTAVTLSASAFDACDGSPSLSWTEDGSPIGTGATIAPMFELGTHTVTVVAKDHSENVSEPVLLTFEIVDTTPPELLASADPEFLWPPNHKYQVIGLTLIATDMCDADVSTFNATVVSSEADDAQESGKGKNKSNGDGNTTGDIRVTKPDESVVLSSNEEPVVSFDPASDVLELRAERAGNDAGRVYTITLTATDAEGNTSVPVVLEVNVEHDQGASKPVVATKPVLSKPISGDEDLAFGVTNYPNPFNPETVILYTLPEDVEVRLVIYNVIGQQVRELVNTHQSPGRYGVRWDGRDALGRSVSSGVYFYRLIAGSDVAIRKMLLIK